jgi:hypothetical protein
LAWCALLRCVLAVLALILILSGAAAAAPAEPTAQVRTPAETVQAYADAANHGDLEAFLALYATDIRKYRFPGTLASEGIDHMRAVYTRSFAEKKGIHVEIAQMIALGDKVVCRDHVTGLPGGKSADELTAYQVQDGRITNIVYLDKVEQ